MRAVAQPVPSLVRTSTPLVAALKCVVRAASAPVDWSSLETLAYSLQNVSKLNNTYIPGRYIPSPHCIITIYTMPEYLHPLYSHTLPPPPPPPNTHTHTQGPCADQSCPEGSVCRVHAPTGVAVCEPTCEVNNGGCASDQTCSLEEGQCATQPCPRIVNCGKQLKTNITPPSLCIHTLLVYT